MVLWKDSYAQRDVFLKSLILANVAVTGLWLKAQVESGKSARSLEFMYDNFTVSSRGIFQEHRYYTLVTSFFSHKSVYHLVNNMYALWGLGPAVIHTIGTTNFALLYMGGGAVSSLAQLYWPYIIPQSWPAYLRNNDGNALGASGAINSLAVWVTCRWPFEMFRLYGVMELPGAVVGAITIAVDLTGLYDGGSKIGHMAHLAGAAFGALFFISSRLMGGKRALLFMFFTMFPKHLASVGRKIAVHVRQNRKLSTYGQQEEGGGGGLVKSILLLNVLVTGAWYSAAEFNSPSISFMRNNFTLSTYGIFHKHNYHTLVTAVFSHISPIHLAFNSFVLYSFGTNVIHALGTARFAFLYLGGGIVSSLAYVIWPYVIPRSWPAYHMHRDEPGVGASGAINSLVIWSVLRWPTSMFYFFGVVPVPAFVAGLGLVAVDAFGLYEGSTNKVGNIAHLGGAAFGAVCFLASKRFRRF